jgi:hypothetical protein
MLRPTASPLPTLHHSLRAVYSGARRRRAEAPTALLSEGRPGQVRRFDIALPGGRPRWCASVSGIVALYLNAVVAMTL